jgi:hypothetical protein
LLCGPPTLVGFLLHFLIFNGGPLIGASLCLEAEEDSCRPSTN